jgi:predicted HTH domain antitoxin
MAVKITIELPDDALAILRSSLEDFSKEFRLAAAVKWYEIGKISQSRAAELAGISRHEFLHSLFRFQVSPFQVTPEELAEELTRG